MSVTIRLTMAQALVKFLDRQYVIRDGEESKFFAGVMGIFGHGNVTGIGQALEQGGHDLTLIQGKNEQGMAHAAIAFAKQRNRLASYACTSSIGPGALNMVTAAGVATVNRIPLLLLPGDNFASRMPDPVLQQLENGMDYTLSAADAFKPVSKYWDRVHRPDQLMVSLLQAMRVLTDPAETGAVTIALPQDVQCEAYDYPEAFFCKRVHLIDRQPPSENSIAQAVSRIAASKRPLMIVGGGIHYADALDEMLQLCEMFHVPVAETQAGKSAMKWDHPLSLGGVGATGTAAANKAAAEADLIIAVGTRLSDFTTSSKTAFKHPDVSFININISSLDTHKTQGVHMKADAKLSLARLVEELRELDYRSSYGIELHETKQAWNAEVDRITHLERGDGLVQTTVLGAINEWIDPDAVVVCAAGSMPGDLHRIWRTVKPKTYHMEYGFSCMGYEVSGAFGVKLAEQDREVYALVGDGSYLMLHSELITSLQERQKITVLLLDNHGYQCIHNLQREQGGVSFGNEFRYRGENGRLEGDYLSIDYAKHAESMGANAFRASSIEELKLALAQAKSSDRSCLIAISVLPGTNTGGYDSWWQVGVSEVSKQPSVEQAYAAYKASMENMRPLSF